MPPKRRAADSAGLRDAIADVLRDGLDVAERFEALGAAGSGDAIRDTLDRLERGAAVTIHCWELAAALDATGAPARLVREVATDRVDAYTVDTDGQHEPALTVSAGA